MMLPELKNFSREVQLNELGLFLLEFGIQGGDLNKVCQITGGIERVNR